MKRALLAAIVVAVVRDIANGGVFLFDPPSVTIDLTNPPAQLYFDVSAQIESLNDPESESPAFDGFGFFFVADRNFQPVSFKVDAELYSQFDFVRSDYVCGIIPPCGLETYGTNFFAPPISVPTGVVTLGSLEVRLNIYPFLPLEIGTYEVGPYSGGPPEYSGSFWLGEQSEVMTGSARIHVVPEPGALMLMVTGLAAIRLHRRRG